MDVYNDGTRIVGRDRAIGQNPDRFGAKRTLDVDLARRDVGQVWCRNGAQQSEGIGATPRQGFGGQRHLWPQRECIAQFGVDKFDCAHGWQPGPFGAKKTYGSDCLATSQRGFRAYRLKRPDTECAEAQETIHGGLARLIPCRRRRPRTQASERMAAQPAGLHVRRSNLSLDDLLRFVIKPLHVTLGGLIGCLRRF